MKKNIIGKSIIDLQFNGKDDGFALQQNVSSWCHQNLLPEIDKSLQKYEFIDSIISIDKLEIEVYIDAENGWLKTVTTKIVQGIEEKLNNKINPDNLILPSLKTPDTNFKEILIFFLHTGFLPWNSIVTTKEIFNTQLIEWLQSAKDENIRSVLNLLEDKTILQRFLYQISTFQFIQFIARIIRINHEKINYVFEDVERIIENFPEKRFNLLNDFKKIIIHRANQASSGKILTESIALWLQLAVSGKVQLENINISSIRSSELIKEIEIRKKKLLVDHKYINLVDAVKDKAEQVQTDEINIDEKIGIENTPAFEKIIEEGIYIGNAGAVIVAPFLPSFFKSISLTDGNLLNDDETAVNILSFIITGKEHPPEFQLLLLKILCGLPAGKLVNTAFDLKGEYKDKAVILLQSIIKHWDVLKNTSIDGLRETFLQREGRLSFHNNEWLLIVEQKSYDILLANLPWPISFIYLPWMKHTLKVNWV